MTPTTPSTAFDALNTKIVAGAIIERLHGNRVIRSLTKNDTDFIDQAAFTYAQGDTITLTKEAVFTAETQDLGDDYTFATPTIAKVDVKLAYLTHTGSSVFDFDRTILNDAQLANYSMGQANSLTRALETQALKLIANSVEIGADAELGTPGTALNFNTLTAIQERMTVNGVSSGTPLTLIVTPAGYRDLIKDADVKAATNRGDEITSSGMILPTLGMEIVPSIYLPLNVADDSVSGTTGSVMIAMSSDSALIATRALADDAVGVDQFTAIDESTGWALRYTRGYDMIKKRTLVSWDILWGTEVYQPNAVTLVRGGIA